MRSDLLKRLDAMERVLNPPAKERKLIVITAPDESHDKMPITKLVYQCDREHVFTRTEDESETQFTDRVNMELSELFPDRLIFIVIQVRD